MKTLNLSILLALLTVVGYAQGIHFLEGTSWKAVLEKAKIENKPIFVDAYATWCMPCKRMDQEVYIDKDVAVFYNSNFISVKYQMDKTNKDSDFIRSVYIDVNRLKDKYAIVAYPSFLFFSSDGKLLHKEVGFKAQNEFVLIGEQALNPENQFFKQLKLYKEHKVFGPALLSLYKTARNLKLYTLADSLAHDYYEFIRSSEEDLLEKTNLEFVGQNGKLVSSTDKIFNLALVSPDKINMAANYDEYSNWLIKAVIIREEILPKLWVGDNSSSHTDLWKNMLTKIKAKYPDVDVYSILIEQKISFYRKNKDWKNFARAVNEKMEHFPPKSKLEEKGRGLSDAWNLNSLAWTVFQECNDTEVLNQALKWSMMTFKLEKPDINIQYYDTRSNLLYKLGLINEAILWQEKGLEKSQEMAKEKGTEKGPFMDSIITVLEKMKKGEPTWPVK